MSYRLIFQTFLIISVSYTHLEDEYIIITAYNSSEIAYIESSSGSVKTMSMNDAGKMFSQGGNIYVTYYK